MTATSVRAQSRRAAPLILGLALAAPLAGCAGRDDRAAPAATSTTRPAATSSTRLAGGRGSVLVFSKTSGFRHQSIPDGIAALREMGARLDLTVDAT